MTPRQEDALWRIEVKVCATAYIKAKTREEAQRIVDDMKNREIGDDIEISGLQFNDPKLPAVSVSTAMTCHGVWETETLELAGDFEEAEECPDCGAVEGTEAWGTVGDGFDGYCPSCADKREEAGVHD